MPSKRTRRRRNALLLCLIGTALLGACGPQGGDWPDWRGSGRDGVATDRELISSWSPEGENLLWKAEFIGRSTPVVLNGRVFVMGRVGEGVERQEVVAAYDAENGELLWERRHNVYLTTVPYNRVGWASLAADRETGYLYAQGVAGLFQCFDQDGNVVWSYSLAEEFGRFSGYGGRTATPTVDEDKVIVGIINSSWGRLGAPRHRYYAFDKKTGEVIWISTPGGLPVDRNTQSSAVIAVIGGQRLYISGNGDGWIYALKARTGEEVWKFHLSKRGINTAVVVGGDRVFTSHSEENVDEGTLGRVVAIDATGTGDVTETHEIWRQDINAGFASPLLHDAHLYVVDNSANLHSLNPENGEIEWEQTLGTVGKGSPVWADGKIYATEVNGHFHILGLKEEGGVEVLDTEELSMPDGRSAEIYSSPAVAYGRVYFTTEEGIYCLGDPNRRFDVAASPAPAFPPEAPGTSDPAVILAVPGETRGRPGDTLSFRVAAFNDTGRSLEEVGASYEIEGLAGSIDGEGRLTLDADGGFQAGEVVARLGELEARARVRVFPELPWSEDFETVQGRGRPHWIGAGRYAVADSDDGRVLTKPVAERGLLRSNLLLGPPDMKDYTIQTDLKGSQRGRRRCDVGLINSGYILDLMGIGQRLQIRSWSAVLRIEEEIDFPWEMDTWYTMKLRVDRDGDRAWIRGKVWPRGGEEPAEWTLEAEDSLPVPHGSPGLVGYSPSPIEFDNVLITVNES